MVQSFNGRTGAVTPQSGDYNASQVGAEPTGALANHAAQTGFEAHIPPGGITAAQIAPNTISSAQIAPNSIQLGRMTRVTAPVILGRITTGLGSPEALSQAQARTVMGLGDVALRNTQEFLERQTLDIPAGAFNQSPINGCGQYGCHSANAYGPNIWGLPFAAGLDQSAEIQIDMPKSWVPSSLAIGLNWTSLLNVPNTPAKYTRWVVEYHLVNQNTPISNSTPAASPVFFGTYTGAFHLQKTSIQSLGIPVTATSDSLLTLRVWRQGSQAGDSLTQSAILTGLQLFYRRSSFNDL